MGCMWSEPDGMVTPLCDELETGNEGRGRQNKVVLKKGRLPPVVVDRGQGGVVTRQPRVKDSPAIMQTIKDDTVAPVCFMLNEDLTVSVKIVQLACCRNKIVWSFVTGGMSRVGQEELVFLMEYLPSDEGISLDVFELFSQIYTKAQQGNNVSHLGFTQLANGTFLGCKDHGGLLYVKSSMQCLDNIPVPEGTTNPLFMILIHKEEVSWLRILPLRVMLRLGLEEGEYPFPLISKRFRPAVFNATDDATTKFKTIVEQHSVPIPFISGLQILIQNDLTVTIEIPVNQRFKIAKVFQYLSQSSEGRVPFAGDLCKKADSHLVVNQVAEKYVPGVIGHRAQCQRRHTRMTRKVTGATYLVLAPISSSCNHQAVSSLVEDGLIINMKEDVRQDLISELAKGNDYTLQCDDYVTVAKLGLHSGKTIHVRWTGDINNGNIQHGQSPSIK